MRYRHFLAVTFLWIIGNEYLSAQQPDRTLDATMVDRYIMGATGKVNAIESKLKKANMKVLRRFKRIERKIYAKLTAKDSLKARKIFKEDLVLTEGEGFEPKLKEYIPGLDSLKTSIMYLEKSASLHPLGAEMNKKLGDALHNIRSLEKKLGQAGEIRKQLKSRQEFLRNQLANAGFVRELKAINKEVYYYSARLQEYKALFRDRKKAERKLLEILGKTDAFKRFMRKNSILASLFRLPGDPDDPVPMQQRLAGLQTRAQVNGMIQQRILSGGPNGRQQLQQNIQAAHSEMASVKERLMKFGAGSSDDIMPEGFRPNSQKAKSFLQRLEWGTNIQSQKASSFFPVTSDIGLSLGYKLNDRSIIGIGGSYKLGWGAFLYVINKTNVIIGERSCFVYNL